MTSLLLQGKAYTGEITDILPVPSKSNLILFVHPSTMKSLHIVKYGDVMVHTREGQLILKSWPCKTIQPSCAALYSGFFQYYMDSPITIEPLRIQTSPAKRVYLYPQKHRDFMTSSDFQSFLEEQLRPIHVREELVIRVSYLGYPCCFTVKSITENTNTTCEEEEIGNELSTPFNQMSLKAFDKNVDESSVSFIENLKASQTSTPSSSRRVLSKVTTIGKNAEDFGKLSSPQKFYFLHCNTKIIIQLNESESKQVYFKDIVGMEENIKHIKSAVTSILQPIFGLQLCTSGILLIGPSGTGKTMIGEALKNEYDLPFYTVKQQDIGSCKDTDGDYLEKIYKDAVRCSPSIIFLDDLDKIFLKEEHSNSSLKKESFIRNLTSFIYKALNYSSNILVIGAVQNENSLPPHFRKNGFFEKELQLSISSSERKQMFLKILRKRNHHLSENEIDEIVEATSSFAVGEILRLCEKAEESVLQDISKKNEDCTITLKNLKENIKQIKPTLPHNFEVPNVRWSEIGGMNKVKAAITEMIDWPLRLSHQFKKFKITPPRGILMYGPPGCSKTMIAKALVTECHLSFISVKGSDLFNKYVGESEKSVSELFKRARSAAPCVLFFDEIDDLTSARDSTSGNSNVCERVLTQLLVEIDGIDTLEGVSILAATNRPDRIDPSFLRPGRFDHTIYVPLPDSDTREEIFKVELQKMPISSDVDIPYLAHATEGYSGADISNVCHLAVQYILKEGITSTSVVTMEHFTAAIKSVLPQTTEEMKQRFELFEKQRFRHSTFY